MSHAWAYTILDSCRYCRALSRYIPKPTRRSDRLIPSATAALAVVVHFSTGLVSLVDLARPKRRQRFELELAHLCPRGLDFETSASI